MVATLLRLTLLLLTQSPLCAKAIAQWILVSKDGNVHADYNSIKRSGNIYTIVFSAKTEDAGYAAGYMHFECKSSRFSVTTGSVRTPWEPIPFGSIPESIAYLVCKAN